MIVLEIKFGIRVFPLAFVLSTKFGMAGNATFSLSVVEEEFLIKINGNAIVLQVINGIQNNARNV